MLVALGEKGVKTLDDLADLASDELIEIVGADSMDEETANEVIMAARAHWFDGRGSRRGAGRGGVPRLATQLPDALDIGEDEPETGPLRRCIVTRERGERSRMIRFVVGPERQVVPDLAAKLPGRGIWLSARRDVLETARAKNAFARAARAPVSVPASLTLMVEEGLARRVGELLGLARRAGQAVCGFQRAREWLVGRPRRDRDPGVGRQPGGTGAVYERSEERAGRSAACRRRLWEQSSAATMWCMSLWRPAGWPRRFKLRQTAWPDLPDRAGGWNRRNER